MTCRSHAKPAGDFRLRSRMHTGDGAAWCSGNSLTIGRVHLVHLRHTSTPLGGVRHPCTHQHATAPRSASPARGLIEPRSRWDQADVVIFSYSSLQSRSAAAFLNLLLKDWDIAQSAVERNKYCLSCSMFLRCPGGTSPTHGLKLLLRTLVIQPCWFQCSREIIKAGL